jgi:nucleotide-binding universal stress UspA family protein
LSRFENALFHNDYYAGTLYSFAQLIEKDADLVVIGTRGMSGIKRMLLGSVAETFKRMLSAILLVTRYLT